MVGVLIKKRATSSCHLKGLGLTFEPGDSLGIYPTNDPELVDLILQETKWNPEEYVTINKQGDVLPLREALLSHTLKLLL